MSFLVLLSQTCPNRRCQVSRSVALHEFASDIDILMGHCCKPNLKKVTHVLHIKLESDCDDKSMKKAKKKIKKMRGVHVVDVEKTLKKITVGGRELDRRSILRAVTEAGVNCRQALPHETSLVLVPSSVGSNSPSLPPGRPVPESDDDEDDVYHIKNYRDYTLYPRAQWDC